MSIQADRVTPSAGYPRPRPSMRGRYNVRNPLAMAYLVLIDLALSFVPVRRRPVPAGLKRIVVANWGQLGDVVTTFGVLRVLRARNPGLHITMLVGSWGRATAQSSGLVDEVLVVDHWNLNRSNLPKKEKRRRFAQTAADAVEALKRGHFDAAIDLYPFYPPAHPLFFRAGIPVRIGFNSGGYGPLLTHSVGWADADRAVSDHYRDVLNVLWPDRPVPAGETRPRLAEGVAPPVPAMLENARPYIIVHPGTGAAFKEWGTENWQSLIDLLKADGATARYRIVLTGGGKAETEAAARIAAGFPDLVNLVGKTDWQTYLATVAHAALVICPDSMAGHAAGLFETPTIAIFSGANKSAQWGPVNPNARVLVHPVPCMPCNRPGCAENSCIRGVKPVEVLAAAKSLLGL